ncbi:MAG: serine/threonine-protein kinase [Acidobacteriota bacterium]|nr:serine/threonine-protein kinase [Acidobacteriota bacterium]
MAVHRYLCEFVPEDIEAALGRRYVIGPEIAVGGQGAVFRATRTSQPDGTAANDVVALKLHFDRRKTDRVQPEIPATENFSHPNLARLIEYGYCDVAGRCTRYIASEFIEGQPLSVLLKNGPLLESEVLAIGRDVLSAIAEIWSQRIVHGDIKPSNIMVRNSGGYMMLGSVDRAVLIDLGAARYLNLHNTRTLRPSRYLDQPDRRAAVRPIGTWGYFSPEQIKGADALSCASDVFSLGVVMLQCLLGRHPTDGDQGALTDGIRASGQRLAASTALLCSLDRMLSARPAFRPNPAELSRRFQSLRQTMLAELAMVDRAPMKAQD